MRKIVKNYQGNNETVTITTEHIMSNYNIPVVLIDGVLLGDNDVCVFGADDNQTGYEIKQAIAYDSGYINSWIMEGYTNRMKEESQIAIDEFWGDIF